MSLNTFKTNSTTVSTHYRAECISKNNWKGGWRENYYEAQADGEIHKKHTNHKVRIRAKVISEMELED